MTVAIIDNALQHSGNLAPVGDASTGLFVLYNPARLLLDDPFENHRIHVSHGPALAAHAHNHVPRVIAIQGVGDASDRKHIQTGQKQCSHARIINKRIEAARCSGLFGALMLPPAHDARHILG